MSDAPAYPCNYVVGDGQLCMEPCDPGFMRCNVHRERMTNRAMAVLMESARERVLRRVEQSVDDAITSIIDLSSGARNESVRLAASKELLQLAGFANVRLDTAEGGALDPAKRDDALMGLIKAMAQNPDKMAALEARLTVIDAESDES